MGEARDVADSMAAAKCRVGLGRASQTYRPAMGRITNEEGREAMTELVKVKRGNALSDLWDAIWKKKQETFLYLKEHAHDFGGFLGQHTNPDRQRKLAVMREKGITGKQYRRQVKRERQLSRGIIRVN
jgi:hypothetical protein